MILLGELERKHVAAVLKMPPKQPLILCCCGGDIVAARAIVDILIAMPRPTVALGDVASAAVPIFAAGCDRLWSPSTVGLWHEPWEQVDKESAFSIDALRLHLADLKEWFAWANRLLGGRTKRPANFWSRLGRGEGTVFGADLALKSGLATGEFVDTVSQSFYADFEIDDPGDDMTGGESDSTEDCDDVDE